MKQSVPFIVPSQTDSSPSATKGPIAALCMRRLLLRALGLSVLCLLGFMVVDLFFYPGVTELLFSNLDQLETYPETALFLPYLLTMGILIGAALLECRRADFPAQVLFHKRPTARAIKSARYYPLLFGAGLVLNLPLLMLTHLSGESALGLNDLWSDWVVSGDPGAAYLENSLFCISAIVIAPLVEEFLFRGLLLHRLSYKYGPKEGLILSSVIFGLMHGLNLSVMFTGFVLGWYYIRTESLWVSIGLHMMHNTLVVLLALLTAHHWMDLTPGHISFWVFCGLMPGCAIWTLNWLKDINLQTPPPFLKIKPTQNVTLEEA